MRFVSAAVLIVLAGTMTRSNVVTTSVDARPSRFAAVAFDALVLFDPGSIVPAAERVFPGNGRALVEIWRTRQFEYSWLRSIEGRYVDFSRITDDALTYAASTMHLQLTDSARRDLMDAYLHLTAWPDTLGALERLQASHVRVIALSNFSPAMLQANVEHAGLTGWFDALISTDVNETYKPDPRAYQLGVNDLHLAKQDIVFAAFGGWDASGAKSFGYPTVWVNRLNQPDEHLDVRPDRTVKNLDGLIDFVLGR